jgi:hypothetical protein
MAKGRRTTKNRFVIQASKAEQERCKEEAQYWGALAKALGWTIYGWNGRVSAGLFNKAGILHDFSEQDRNDILGLIGRGPDRGKPYKQIKYEQQMVEWNKESAKILHN